MGMVSGAGSDFFNPPCATREPALIYQRLFAPHNALLSLNCVPKTSAKPVTNRRNHPAFSGLIQRTRYNCYLGFSWG